MAETDPPPPDASALSDEAEPAERPGRGGVYEREGEIYRAHQIRSPDDGPATADFIVRRDSDARYGGYIVDLAADGGDETFGPEDPRYEAYDDCGRLVTAASSLLGALSIFVQTDRGIRWISDRSVEPEIEPGI
jgi:hypothetical protein